MKRARLPSRALGTSLADRVVRTGVAAAIVAVAAQTVAHLAYVFVFDGDVPELNVDAEANTWSWMSSSVTFAAGAMALLVALADRGRTRRFLALATVLFVFSVDDAVSGHEEVADAVADRFDASERWAEIAWPLVFIPLFGLASITTWQVSSESPRNVRAILRVGLALLVVAVATGLLSTAWYDSEGYAETAAGAFTIVVEEGAELGGWILLGSGLAALAILGVRALPETGG